MIKKIYILTILAAMMFTLVACGSKEAKTATNDASSTEEIVDAADIFEADTVDEVETSESEEDAVNESEDTQAEPTYPKWRVGSDIICRYYDGLTDKASFHFSIDMPDDVETIEDSDNKTQYRFISQDRHLFVQVDALRRISKLESPAEPFQYDYSFEKYGKYMIESYLGEFFEGHIIINDPEYDFGYEVTITYDNDDISDLDPAFMNITDNQEWQTAQQEYIAQMEHSEELVAQFTNETIAYIKDQIDAGTVAADVSLLTPDGEGENNIYGIYVDTVNESYRIEVHENDTITAVAGNFSFDAALIPIGANEYSVDDGIGDIFIITFTDGGLNVVIQNLYFVDYEGLEGDYIKNE